MDNLIANKGSTLVTKFSRQNIEWHAVATHSWHPIPPTKLMNFEAREDGFSGFMATKSLVIHG